MRYTVSEGNSPEDSICCVVIDSELAARVAVGTWSRMKLLAARLNLMVAIVGNLTQLAKEGKGISAEYHMLTTQYLEMCENPDVQRALI